MFGPAFEDAVRRGGQSWQQGREAAGHQVSMARTQSHGSWSSAASLLLIQPGIPSHGMVLPTFSMDLLSSMKPLWKHHLRHPQRCLLGDSKPSQADNPCFKYIGQHSCLLSLADGLSGLFKC